MDTRYWLSKAEYTDHWLCFFATPSSRHINDEPLLLSLNLNWTASIELVRINYYELAIDSMRVLGTGASARVYKGNFQNQSVAVKMLSSTEITQDIIDTFVSEGVHLQNLKHPNIVGFFGVCIAPPALAHVLEICEGSLFDLLRASSFEPPPSSPSSLPLTSPPFNDIGDIDVVDIAKQCCRAVAFLHSKRLIHSDLKSLNFLYKAGPIIKLADLEQVSTAPTNEKGYTPRWAAPEILRGEQPTFSSDVYSLAMVVYECLSRDVPFANIQSRFTVQNMVLNGERPHFQGKEEHEAFKHYFYATPSGASAVVILQRAWRRFSRMRAMVAWSNPESDRHRHVVEEHEHCLRAANVVRDYIARHDYSFAELDRDGSGFIERSEFDALLKECHVESADALWRRFSRANDLDGFVKFIKDGNVDIAEAKLRAVLHAADSDLYDVFAVFDEDGDGSVSRDDFAQALHELGFDRNLHQHEVEDLAARLIDDGGDDKGRIDYDAFLERFGNFRDFQKAQWICADIVVYLEERATVERYRAERAHHVQKARSALATLAKGIELGPTPRLDDFSVSSMSSSASSGTSISPISSVSSLHSPRKAQPEVEVEEEIAPYADESSEAQVDKTKREVPYSDTIVQVQEAGAEQEAGTGAEHIARDAEEEKKKREEKKEIETQKQHLLAMLAEHQKDAEVQRMEMENSMKEHLRQLAAQEAFNRSREMEKMRTELEHVKAKDGQLSRVERDFEELKKIQLEKNAELEILQKELAMKREGEQAELERL
eukprot:g3730.t1